MFYKQDSAPPTRNFRVDLFDKEGMQTPGDMTKEAPRRDLPNAAIFVVRAPYQVPGTSILYVESVIIVHYVLCTSRLHF